MVIFYKCFDGEIAENHYSLTKPKNLLDHIEDKTVIKIEASGAELAWIRENISGIPFSKNKTQVWHGDHAKFIFSALVN